MSRNMILGGVCVLLLGLLLGYMAGSGGPSLKDIDRAVSARLDASDKAEADRVAALEAKVADLGTRLDSVSSQVQTGADAVKGLGDRIGGNLDALGAKLGDSVAAAGQSSIAALQSGLDKLQQSLPAEGPQPVAAPTGVAAPAGASGNAPAASGASDASTGTPGGSTAGETVVLSESARVFVSRIDDATGEAILYVNGEPTTLKSGESVSFQAGGEDCQLTLAKLDRGHADLKGACGAALPEAEGAAPGTVVTLADGAVRVFVSGVEAEGARIAINGVETRDVAVGETVDVTAGDRACKVSVTGVDRGHVALNATCS